MLFVGFVWLFQCNSNSHHVPFFSMFMWYLTALIYIHRYRNRKRHHTGLLVVEVEVEAEAEAVVVVVAGSV